MADDGAQLGERVPELDPKRAAESEPEGRPSAPLLPPVSKSGSHREEAERMFLSGQFKHMHFLTLCKRSAMDLLEQSGRTTAIQGPQRLELASLSGDRLPIFRSHAQSAQLGWATDQEFPVLFRLLEGMRTGTPTIDELYPEIVDLCGRADLARQAAAQAAE
jgi:hypothetical protein